MNQLTKYDAARYALSAAVQVDEVKDIRDKAEAMAAYARQAKDTELVQWATEIKVRAERKAGQMLAEMPKAKGEILRGTTMLPRENNTSTTLAEIGITKNESSRWQKLAAVTDTQFEHAVAAAKEVAGEVTTAAMLRAAKETSGTVATPKPTPAIAPVTIHQIDDDGAPDDSEIESVRLQDEAAAKTMQFLLASDAPLADLAAKNTELEAQIKLLNLRISGLQNSNNEYIKTIKRLQSQLKKVQA